MTYRGGRTIGQWAAAILTAAVGVAGCSGDSPPPIDASLGVPAPLRPWNGEMTGSAHAARALRPRFQWKAVDGSTTYDLQVDDSCPAIGFAGCAFSSPEIDRHGLTASSFEPDQSLAVSLQQPVGRRYYWRVRACHAAGCSRWSAVRYVDVGRVAEDLNGDGYADVTVGSDPGPAAAGRAFIYMGGKGPLSTAPDLILTRPRVGDGFGYALTPAGDVNGDGYPDLIVGAYTDSTAGDSAGQAYIYLGSATPSTAPALTMTGAPGDFYGIAVSTAGDVNGDGFADFVVGAAGVGAGRAEIFYGGATLHDTPDLTLFGETAGDFFGYPVRALGDVNGDGFADLGASATANGHAGAGAGRAYVFLGGANMNAAADLVLEGEAAGDSFGSLAGGDFDGDGYADIAVGAYHNDGAASDAGRVYLYRGGAALSAVPDFFISGAGPDAHLGPHGFADLNGDGLADLLVGSAPVGGYRTFVYYGRTSTSTSASASAPTAADLSMAGDDASADVQSAGDVDGDGFEDMVVGASSADLGHAYLYRGGATPATAATDTLTGLSPGQAYGICVAWVAGAEARGQI